MYGVPPHNTYGAPPQESYGPPSHHDSYHEPPYHIESYQPEPVYEAGYDPHLNGDGGGFGGFGKEHGFGSDFASQGLRRGSENRPRSPGARKDRPRKLDFSLAQHGFKETQHPKSEFGFDELKAFGFGLRV